MAANDVELRIKALVDGQADVKKFVEELVKLQAVANSNIAASVDKIADSLGGVNGKATSASGSIAGGFIKAQVILETVEQVVGAVVKQFDNLLKKGDEIAKLRDRFGVAAESLQELKFAAELSDTSITTVTKAMATLTTVASKFKEEGGSAGSQAMRYLGIDPAEFKDAEDGFLKVIKATGELGDEQNRVAVLSAIFGKGVGPELAGLASKGAAGIDDLRKRAQELGLVLSDKTITRVDEFKDRLETLGKVRDANFGNAIASALPDLERMLEVVERLFSVDEQGGALGAAIRFVAEQGAGIARGFDLIYTLFRDVVKLALDLAPSLGGAVTKTTALEVALQVVSLGFAGIVDIIGAIAAAITQASALLLQGFGAAITGISNGVAKLVSFFDKDLANSIRGTGSGITEFANQIDAAAKKYVSSGSQFEKTLAKIRATNERNRITAEADLVPNVAFDGSARTSGPKKKPFKVGNDPKQKKAIDSVKSAFSLEKATLEAQYKILTEVVKAGEDQINQAYKDGELSIEQTFDSRLAALRVKFDAEQRLREEELVKVNQAIASTSDPNKQNDLKRQKVDIESRVVLSQISLAVGEEKLKAWKAEQERALSDLKVSLNVQLANAEGRFDPAALRAQLEQQFRDASLKLGDDAAGLRLIERIKAATLAQAEFNAKLDQAQDSQQGFANAERILSAERERGVIGPLEAEGRLLELRKAQVSSLEVQLAALTAAAATLPPDAIGKIAEANQQIAEMGIRIAELKPAAVDFASTFNVAFQSNVGAAFDSFVRGTDTLGQAFKKMLVRIGQDIASSNIKRALTDLFTPDKSADGGGILSAIGKLFGGGTASTGGSSGAFGIGVNGAATGGLIGGRGGPTEDANLMALSRGEFVMRAAAVKSLGADMMHYINKNGRLPRGFAAGGLNGVSVASATPATVQSSVNVSLVNQTSQPIAKPEVQRDANGDLQIWLRDLESNGPRAQALQRSFGLKRATV